MFVSKLKAAVGALVVLTSVGLLLAGPAGAQDLPPNGAVVELPDYPNDADEAYEFRSAISPDGTVVLGRSGFEWADVLTCVDRACSEVVAVDLDVNIDLQAMLFEPAGDLLMFGEVRRGLTRAVVVIRCGRQGGNGPYCGGIPQVFELNMRGPGEFCSGECLKDVVLDREGLPLLLMGRPSGVGEPSSVELVRCADPGCLRVASTTGVGSTGSKLMLDDQGRPSVVVWISDADQAFGIVRCDDVACTTTTRTEFSNVSVGLSAEDRWQIEGLVIAGSPPRPVMVMRKDPTSLLALVDCGDFDCSAPSSSFIDEGDAAHASGVSAIYGVTPSNELFTFQGGLLAICDDTTCQSGVETRAIAVVASGRFNFDQPSLVFEPSGRFVAMARDDYATVCESLDCRLAETSQIEFSGQCLDGGVNNALWVPVNNLSNSPIQVEVRTSEITESVEVPAQTPALGISDAITVRNSPEGPVAVVVSIDGVEVASQLFGIACRLRKATSARASCLGGAGRVDVLVVRETGPVPQTYRVRVGDDERVVTIDEGGMADPRLVYQSGGSSARDELVTFTRRPDGELPVQVIDDESGATVYESTVTVLCNTQQVNIALSCLAGNGRIDTTIVERLGAQGTWRLQVGTLSPRVRTVNGLDWWRSPITGRPDGPIDVEVFRNDRLIERQTLEVACDSAPPVVSDVEVVPIVSCRAGLGYILFQFVNSTAAAKSWIIEFEGVPNRSTSAEPFGASVRAVTGRRPGTYGVTVNGIAQPPVVVSC